MSKTKIIIAVLMATFAQSIEAKSNLRIFEDNLNAGLCTIDEYQKLVKIEKQIPKDLKNRYYVIKGLYANALYFIEFDDKYKKDMDLSFLTAQKLGIVNPHKIAPTAWNFQAKEAWEKTNFVGPTEPKKEPKQKTAIQRDIEKLKVQLNGLVHQRDRLLNEVRNLTRQRDNLFVEIANLKKRPTPKRTPQRLPSFGPPARPSPPPKAKINQDFYMTDDEDDETDTVKRRVTLISGHELFLKDDDTSGGIELLIDGKSTKIEQNDFVILKGNGYTLELTCVAYDLEGDQALINVRSKN